MNTTLVGQLETHLATWRENEVRTTKEIASSLGCSTAQAYDACGALEYAGLVSKYGYRVKDGWEDPGHSNRRCDSLGWQVNEMEEGE